MEAVYAESLEWAAARQDKQRVKLILHEFGLQKWRGQVYDEHYAVTGDRRLSVAAFNRVFPGFPIHLKSLPLYGLGSHTRCNQTAMFRDFRKYVPYEQFLAEQDTLQAEAFGRPIGILYRWPGIRHGLILHNGEFPTNGFKQTFMDDAVRVTVEHFGRFLRTLAAGDITLESLRLRPQETPAPASPPKLGPWALARRCQGEAEFRLLAYLVEVLFHMSPATSQKYIVRVEGERWVAITEDQLAKRIGLSTRTIQRTICSLRGREIIETRRDGYGKNQIRLCPEVFQ